MIDRGREKSPKDTVTAEEEIKDPFVLEFLGLKIDRQVNRSHAEQRWRSRGCSTRKVTLDPSKDWLT